jgi:hypothetical protein
METRLIRAAALRTAMAVLVLTSSWLAAEAAAQDSTVLGISIKADDVRAGSPVSATASGSGFCGAVHIDWGDGTAITYATSTLPVAQSHVYKYGGVFTVRAQGMGNCTGQATTRVKVTGPPPPPPPPPPPAPAPPRAPAPKENKPDDAVARIVDLEISQPANSGASVRAIRVNGSGTCAYSLDFGDGNSEGRNARLPDAVRHNYPAEGRYTVVATAAPPCTGRTQTTIVIGPRSYDDPPRIPDRIQELKRLTVTPLDVRIGDLVDVTVEGSGRCRVVVDFGDDRQREVTEVLPYRMTHRYAIAGDFEIVAWTYPPCDGGASADVRVRRR